MRFLNPGILELMSSFNGRISTQEVADDFPQPDTKYFIKEDWDSSMLYDFDSSLNEVWFKITFLEGIKNHEIKLLGTNIEIQWLDSNYYNAPAIYIVEKDENTGKEKSVLYKKPFQKEKISVDVEIHYRGGKQGCIDIWLDTKLFLSFRSPTAFPNPCRGISWHFNSLHPMTFNQIVIQDTGRIGYTLFKKIDIDPNDEQVLPLNSTTAFTLSKLEPTEELTEISALCIVTNTTSRDADINTGSFSYQQQPIGDVDLSSTGKAFTILSSFTNPITHNKWRVEELEGKQIKLTIKGA